MPIFGLSAEPSEEDEVLRALRHVVQIFCFPRKLNDIFFGYF